MNTISNRAAAVLAAGLISLGAGALSAGQAQAAEHSSEPSASANASISTQQYQARETRYVYSSPTLTAQRAGQVLEGEIITAETEIVTDGSGVEFVYAWTFNYRTGHFFRGYVEVDNLQPIS